MGRVSALASMGPDECSGLDGRTSAMASMVEWQTSRRHVAYPDAVRRMQDRVAAIRSGGADELVWLLEHPALYTAGTSARAEDLTDKLRFPTFDAGRGGQWTYHGPGQRVAYVMLDLTHPHGQVRARDVRSYVAGLEAWLIAALAQLGVAGETREGRIGIWVGDDKIAALGGPRDALGELAWRVAERRARPRSLHGDRALRID